MGEQQESADGQHTSASVPIGYAEYVAILVVVGVIVLGALILLGPAIAHWLAGLFPHLFAT